MDQFLKSAKKVVFFVVILLGAVGAHQAINVHPVAAQDQECNPIDVVILIDQSDSMFQGNDPLGKRFQAAKSIVDYLGNHAVWLCFEDNVQHRISIVGYGDQSEALEDENDDLKENNDPNEDTEIYVDSILVPQVVSSLEQIKTFEDWKAEREAIKEEVDTGKPRTKELGATDHKAALEVATQILQDWRDEEIEGLPRRQAIILLTDGEPCIRALGCGTISYNYIGRNLDEIREFADPFESNLPFRGGDNRVYLSVILLSRQEGGDYLDIVVDLWNEVAESHGGSVKQSASSSNADLSGIIVDLMSPITGIGQEPLECDQEFQVDPYTDNLMILYAFGSGEGQADDIVSVRVNADGEEFELVGGVLRGTSTYSDDLIQDYIPDQNNEIYILSPPIPGIYTITTEGPNCAAEFTLRRDVVEISASMVGEVNESTVSRYPEVDNLMTFEFIDEVLDKLAIEVQTAVGVPLETQVDGYPINVVANIDGPNGPLAPITFEFKGEGIFEAVDYLPVSEPGDYQWKISADVRETNAQTRRPLEAISFSGSYTVNPIIGFGFDITSPVAGDELPLNSVSGKSQVPEDISVAVQLVTEDGAPVDFELLNDSSNVFTAELKLAGSSNSTEILLAPSATLGEFVGTFPNTLFGGINAEGSYEIVVTTDWGGPDNFDWRNFAPLAKTSQSIELFQYEIKPLVAKFVFPENQTIHSNRLMGAFWKEIEPFELGVIVEDVDGNLLNWSDVIAAFPTDKSIRASDVGNPDINEEEITVEYQELNNLVVGKGGQALTNPSAVNLEFRLDDIRLKDEYSWGDEVILGELARNDMPLTTPWIVRTLAAVAALIMALMIGYLIYIFSGGPTGTVALYPETSGRRGERLPTWEKRLSRFRRVNRFSDAALRAKGIKQIRVRRGMAFSSEGGFAIEVEADGIDNSPLIVNEVLEPGDGMMIAGDEELQYMMGQF